MWECESVKMWKFANVGGVFAPPVKAFKKNGYP